MSELGVSRVTRNVNGEEGTVTREGVVWAAARMLLPSRLVVGLMSVKPRRSPDEGGPIVGRTLLGCISDMGGLMGDEPPGVLGPRAGDEGTGSRLLLTGFGFGSGAGAALIGLSSCSATDDRGGDSVAGFGAYELAILVSTR